MGEICGSVAGAISLWTLKRWVAWLLSLVVLDGSCGGLIKAQSRTRGENAPVVHFLEVGPFKCPSQDHCGAAII